MDEQKVFIIDTYNRFEENKDVVRQFKLNGIDYCIRCVPLEWGKAILQNRVRFDDEEDANFCLYSTREEAESYVHELRKLNY